MTLKTTSLLRLGEKELTSKRLSKYIASFDYFENSLIVLSAKNGNISIAALVTVIGAPVIIASASFSPAFLMSRGIVKNY